MELIPEFVEELEPTETDVPIAERCGDGADGTDGFPEEVSETEFVIAVLDTGILLFRLLAAMWSIEFT